MKFNWKIGERRNLRPLSNAWMSKLSFARFLPAVSFEIRLDPDR